MSEIVIFEGKNGEIQVKLEKETVWLNLNQLVELFGRDKSVISRHLANVFKEEELKRDAVVAKNATTAADGKTYQVDFFNLDVIISLGYRVRSQQGVKFRQWATRLLKEHLSVGFTLNQQRFEENATELEAALALVKKVAKSSELTTDAGRGLVEIVSRYTQTFLWLQRYDEGLLNEPSGQAGGKLPTEKAAKHSLAELKANLIKRGEATELFGNERSDGLGSILGNLDQTVFGDPAYPSIQNLTLSSINQQNFSCIQSYLPANLN